MPKIPAFQDRRKLFSELMESKMPEKKVNVAKMPDSFFEKVFPISLTEMSQVPKKYRYNLFTEGFCYLLDRKNEIVKIYLLKP